MSQRHTGSLLPCWHHDAGILQLMKSSLTGDMICEWLDLQVARAENAKDRTADFMNRVSCSTHRRKSSSSDPMQIRPCHRP